MSDPTDTLRARVEQAQALAAAATPGPWRSEGDTMTGGVDYRYVMVPLPVGTSVASGIIARCQRFGTHAHEAAANADMMAAAPDLVALVTDLWSAYATRAQDASVAVARACLERDAALAEVARLRGRVEAPAVAGGRELTWVAAGKGWHLCWADDPRWVTAPYSAWPNGDVESYKRLGARCSREAQCDDIRAAVLEAARMARADGHIVLPHPLGWDVGVSNG